MIDPLLRKLARAFTLGEEDQRVLTSLWGGVRRLPAKQDLAREGDRPDHVRLVLEGWGARYRLATNGSRQITAFLIPGDLCDLQQTVLDRMDHGIASLSPVTIAAVPHEVIADLGCSRPDLHRALWWSALADDAVSRAWMVGLGRRGACERLAHLLCELHMRLGDVALVVDDAFVMPPTQEELADALGLTSVHCNRMLRDLDQAGLIGRSRGHLAILDLQRLRLVAGFHPEYLRSCLPRFPSSPGASAVTFNAARSRATM